MPLEGQQGAGLLVKAHAVIVFRERHAVCLTHQHHAFSLPTASLIGSHLAELLGEIGFQEGPAFIHGRFSFQSLPLFIPKGKEPDQLSIGSIDGGIFVFPRLSLLPCIAEGGGIAIVFLVIIVGRLGQLKILQGQLGHLPQQTVQFLFFQNLIQFAQPLQLHFAQAAVRSRVAASTFLIAGFLIVLLPQLRQVDRFSGKGIHHIIVSAHRHIA